MSQAVDSRAYLPRKWRVASDQGATAYFGEKLEKMLIKHGWPSKVISASGKTFYRDWGPIKHFYGVLDAGGFVVLYRHPLGNRASTDWYAAVAAAVRVLASQCRVKVDRVPSGKNQEGVHFVFERRYVLSPTLKFLEVIQDDLSGVE